jgi:hypothetical protein
MRSALRCSSGYSFHSSGCSRYRAASGGGRLLSSNVTARITAVGGNLNPFGSGCWHDNRRLCSAASRWPPVATVESIAPTEVHEAQDLYDGSAESCRLRAVQTQLDEPLQAGMTRMGDIRRVERLKAYSALRVRVLPTGQVIAP